MMLMNDVLKMQDIYPAMFDDEKNTTLHRLCSNQKDEAKQVKQIRAILSTDTCVSTRNAGGFTPLSLVTLHQYPNLDLLKLLLKHGANPDLLVSEDCSAFRNMVRTLERLQIELIDSCESRAPYSTDSPRNIPAYTNKFASIVLCLGADVVCNPQVLARNKEKSNTHEYTRPPVHSPVLNVYDVERLFYNAFLAGDEEVCYQCLAARPRLLLDMFRPMRDRMFFFINSPGFKPKCSRELTTVVFQRCRNPPRLEAICIQLVRERVGKLIKDGNSLTSAVHKLPLPRLLQKEIMLLKLLSTDD